VSGIALRSATGLLRLLLSFGTIVVGHATFCWAGGMLAFARSFDEIVVTTFTAGQHETLPILLAHLLTREPRAAPRGRACAIPHTASDRGSLRARNGA
jgi:ABC-type spermidine/putrescine transport system permease subunit II